MLPEATPLSVAVALLRAAQAEYDEFKAKNGQRARILLVMASGKEYSGDRLEERDGVWRICTGKQEVGFSPLWLSAYKMVD